MFPLQYRYTHNVDILDNSDVTLNIDKNVYAYKNIIITLLYIQITKG